MWSSGFPGPGQQRLNSDFNGYRSFFIRSYIYKIITPCARACACVWVQVHLCIHARYLLQERSVIFTVCRCECTYVFVRFLYNISMQKNLPDSDAIFTKYRCKRISRIWTRYLQSIGVSESPGFGRGIYKV